MVDLERLGPLVFSHVRVKIRWRGVGGGVVVLRTRFVVYDIGFFFAGSLEVNFSGRGRSLLFFRYGFSGGWW